MRISFKKAGYESATLEQLMAWLISDPDTVENLAIEGTQRDFLHFTKGFPPERREAVAKVWKFTDVPKS